MIINDEKKELFELVRHKLGAPIRKVELTDEMLCSLLEIAQRNYSEKIQNFIIESNWASLYGKTGLSSMTNTDWAWALSVRTLDMSKEFSYYFSKEVGLQQRGPWELKKDFFEIEPGRQVYVIPAGREIGGSVVGQLGLGGGAAFAGMAGAGFGGLYAMPLYDVALVSADMKEKNKFLGCDLVYKGTAGPNGTHLIHLESVPGGRFEKMGGFGRRHPMFCWYTYYDISNKSEDECNDLLVNGGLVGGSGSDVLLSPDQIPLSKMDYAFMNDPSKTIVRQLLVGEAAETLGFVRGKFSGNINMVASNLTMDYNMLITFGQNEKKEAMTALTERLTRLSPYDQMEKQAGLVKNLIEIRRAVPLGIYVK